MDAPRKASSYITRGPFLGPHLGLRQMLLKVSAIKFEQLVDKRLWHRKYQFMETSMQRKAAGLREKIPDIQKTLDAVRFLKTRTVRLR